MFVNKSENSLYGGTATGVPGEIKGYYRAHKIGGSLPWKELIQPTIDLCTNGFKISKALAGALSDKEQLIKKNSMLSQMFINPYTNSVYKMGDIIRLPQFAKTLKYISESDSDDVFYNGLLSGLVVSEVNKNGGNFTIEDLQTYDVIVHEDKYVMNLDENYRIYFAPPPSSGILVAFMMKIMKGFNVGAQDWQFENTTNLFNHRFVEAKKHAN